MPEPIATSSLSGRVRSYLVAVAVSAAALLLRLALGSFFGGGVAYITFYPAVMFAATFGGLGPGLVATACSAIGAAIWIVPAPPLMTISAPGAVGLAVFTTLGVALSISSGVHWRSRQRIAAYERHLALQRSEDALHRKEEEARERAVELEAILNCIGDGVVVYDREGRIIRSNPAADEMLLLPPAARAAPIQERVAAQYEITTEDGRRLPPDETIAYRAAVRGESVKRTVNRVQTHGHEARWLMISATPLLVAGRHQGAVLSMTDLTERKRAEAELATVTRLYAVLTRVNEAIVRTRDEPSLFAELCRIVADESGFPLVWVGRLEGRAVVPAASAGPAAGYLRGIAVELDGPRGQGPTGTCIREDRPVINDDFALNPSTWPWREATARHGLRASAAFPLHRDGRVTGAVTFYAARAGAFTPQQVRLLESLCADVSFALDALARERLRTEAEAALRDANDRLREADRHKDEFLGMLSHELRNPLAPVRNSIYLLQHAAPGSEQALRAQAVIQRQTEHLTRLVDDLLDVTRIARGKIALRRARVDLRDLVARAAEDFVAVMQDRGVRFEVAIPEGRLWADADGTRVAQVVGNLLHNAAKFTRRGDTVALALAAADGCAELRVRDTGAGIDLELLPRVFDAFVQGERTLARTEGGLGLGLALVKGITELHGGTVRADSAGDGRGAEFTVRLPLLAGREAEVRPGARAARQVPGRRVLVVDDNTDGAESLADVLRMLGHVVEVAYDGPTALEMARAAPPEVVLCDLGLPGMSGYEVAAALRAAATAGMRLYAVSGYAQDRDVQRAIEAGFDGHLAKPCDPDQIARLLG